MYVALRCRMECSLSSPQLSGRQHEVDEHGDIKTLFQEMTQLCLFQVPTATNMEAMLLNLAQHLSRALLSLYTEHGL